ncbi:ABC transporter ATP-binding protein, partial [Salmonella enterica subsp. enterica serovar Colindale]|nr:ABC transporter ATP-binding protein [Salmonella enterica subsp. enterica serovar Colindale]
TYFRQYLTELITIRITSRLREMVLNHLLSLPFSFYQKKQTGDLCSRVISDINNVATLVSGGLVYIWIDLSSIIVVGWLVVNEDLLVGGASLIFLPLYIYMMRHFRNRVRMASSNVQKLQGDIATYTQDRLVNIDSVRGYNAHMNEEKKIREINLNFQLSFLKRSRIKSLNLLVLGQLTQLPSVIILVLGGYRVISGDLSVGSFIALTMYIRQIFWPLDRVSEFNVNFAAASASLERIYNILDSAPEYVQSNNTLSFPIEYERFILNNVTAFYPTSSRKILSDITLSISRGEVIAIAGPSGSGKTTLARIFERTITPYSGSVFIDNTNISEIDLIDYRDNVKIIPQNPVLFSDTIGSNVSYPQDVIDSNTLYQACAKSGALEFILELPNTFDYYVGERGNRLSGGQRQRISISRALASSANVLIFDEPTSSLDVENERAFYSFIDKLRGQFTVIIIAHRPAIFDYVDRVILLNKGRLEALGTIEYLKTHSSLFRRMYKDYLN